MSKSSQSILGIYTYVDVLIDVIKKLRSEGFEDLRAFSPVPIHEIEDALDTGKEPSKIKYFTFCGAIIGALVGVAFTVLTSISWPIVTSAKPIVSIPPYMIIIFECMILIGGLSTFLGLLINSRLRKDTPPELYDERFSDNKFGILVNCDSDDLEKIENILRDFDTDEVQINGVLKEEDIIEELQTEEEKTEEEKTEEEKPSEAKPAEEKPAEAKPAEEKPVEAKPAEEKPSEAKPAEEKKDVEVKTPMLSKSPPTEEKKDVEVKTPMLSKSTPVKEKNEGGNNEE